MGQINIVKMKNMTKLFFLFVLCGCYTSNHTTVKKLTQCYDSKHTGIDSLINLDGYYKLPFVYQEKDTVIHNILLFTDGLFLYNFDLEYYQESKANAYGFYNRGGVDWGVYKLTNDTIYVQTVESPGGMSWLQSEMMFRIIDSVTLERLQLDLNDNSMRYLPAKFVAYADIPDPNKSWIMNKKWFWCNEEAYKKWKKNNR